MAAEIKHVVERAYGVEHRHQILLGGSPYRDVYLQPSGMLIGDLESLPKGSIVGIEDFDPKEVRRLTKKVDGRSFYFKKGSVLYWDYIKYFCNAAELTVAYLDDFRVFREFMAKLFERDGLKEEMGYRVASGEITQDQTSKLAEGIYRADVEAQYIFQVKREEKIVERIAKYRPDRVIFGRDHGDCLTVHSELLSDHGISIDKYLREGTLPVDPVYYLLSDHNLHYHAQLLSSGPDLETILRRKLLLRKYQSLTEGNFGNIYGTPPDFVGTWDLRCPARGYFEMYVNGQVEGEPFSGICEDCLGTADFEGEIDGGFVQFLKSYREGESVAEPNIPVLYEGYFKGGKYEGDYSFPGEEENRGFVLNSGSKLMAA